MLARRYLAAFTCAMAGLFAISGDTNSAPTLSKAAAAEGEKTGAAQPGDVDLARSRVYIFVAKKGRLGHEHGVVGKLKSGHVSLAAESDPGELEFDMTSFLADTRDARKYVGLEGETDAKTQMQVTDSMLSANVLNVKQHPTAKFVIKSVVKVKATKPGEPAKYKLEGEFTLFGTTKPLSLVAQADKFESQTRLRCNFKILQTEYGIRPYSTGFGAVGVADELKIWGDVLVRP